MRYYFILQSPNAPDLALETEPLGWEDTRFALKRDEKWQGVFLNFMVELQFLCEGKAYIERIYRTKGVEAEIILNIYHSCAEENPVKVFVGRLDLATLKWYPHSGLGCAIEASGPQRLLLNRRQLAVDLLQNTTFSGLAMSPLPPLAALENTNGLPIRQQVLAQWNALSQWGQDLDGFPTNLGGAVCTTAVGKFGILSCEDPTDVVDTNVSAHALEYYMLPGFDTVYTELPGYTPPILDYGNYTENECDALSIEDPAEHPPVLLKAYQTGTYTIESCICGRFVVWVSTDGRESCATGRTNDFDDARITLMATINDGTAFEVCTVPQPFLAPNVTSNDLVRCDTGVFQFDLPGDLPRYLDTNLCLNLKTDIALTVGDELRLFVHIQVRGKWLRPDFSACICAFFYGCLTEVCCLRISFDSEVHYPGTQILGCMAQEAFGRMVQSLTDNAMGFYSEYLGRSDGLPHNVLSDGCGSRLFLTNGLNIRRFPATATTLPPPDTCGYAAEEVVQARFFMSLEQLFDNLDAIYNLGAAFTEYAGQKVLRIEPKAWFYRTETILEIRDIDGYEADIQRKVRYDLYYGAFEGGYTRWESESINGIFEYNARRNWHSVLATSPNRLEKSCAFIASGYTFERTRRKPFEETGSTDDSLDHEIFVLCTQPTTLVSDTYLTTAEMGAESPTQALLFPTRTYNFRIRPRANALRWLSVVGAGTYPLYSATPFLYYNDGEGNAYATGGDPLTGLCNQPNTAENSPIYLTESPQPIYYIPEEIQLKYPISFAQFNKLAANPYGRILVNGEPFYLLSLQFCPNQEAEFRLLKAKI